MNRRTALIASAGALAASACGLPGSGRVDLRYRLKIEIFAGGRMRQGSGVMRSLLSDIDTGTAWAEAIPIDMGSGDYLFAVLGGVDAMNGRHRFWPSDINTFRELFPSVERRNVFGSYAEETPLRGVHAAGSRCRPQLVRYERLDDPTTAQFIKWPGENYRPLESNWGRSLADAYGGDARIEAVSLELVNDPVSQRIRRILPWVNELPGAKPGFHVAGWGDPTNFGGHVVYRHFRMEAYYSS